MATVRRLQATIEGKDKGAVALFGKLKGAIGALGAIAIAVGTIALGKKLVKGLAAATKAAGVQEAAEIKLAKALALSGSASVNSLPGLKAYASALQDLTGVGDEAILSSQALLVSIGKLSGPVLEAATIASLDLAAAIGIDQRTAFDLIAKAASGYTGTLSRYGIILDESIPASEKFAAVLKTINNQFGGQAAARLKTFEGRLEEFNGRLGDLKEAIGGPFLEVTKIVLGQGLSPLVKEMTAAKNASSGFRDAIIGSAIAIAELGITLIEITESKGFKAFIQLITLGKKKIDFEISEDLRKKFREAGFFDVPPIEIVVAGEEGAKAAFQRILIALRAIEFGAEDVTKTFEDVFVGPIEPISLLNEELKKLGITLGTELATQAATVKAALLALEEVPGLSPKRYEVIRRKLVEIAEAIVEEGGVVPGFVAARDAVIRLEEAIAILADKGMDGLNKAIADANARLERLSKTIRRALRGVAVRAAQAFGTALVDAASGGSKAFGDFFKQLLKDLAAAIIQALILRAILGAFGIGGGKGTSVPSTGADASFSSTKGQRGLLIPGSDIGRDRVPAILRPGELVFPRELSDFILSLAGTGGGSNEVSIELRSDIPLFIERVNTLARQGSARVIATELATTRRIR